LSSIEGNVITFVQIDASAKGWRLFRNSVGQAWVGRKIGQLKGNSIVIADPRRVKYGLCVGSSDLIGWRPLKITQDMVGQTLAQFAAVECKTEGYNKTTEKQSNFLQQVSDSGGAAFIARGDGKGGVKIIEIIKNRTLKRRFYLYNK